MSSEAKPGPPSKRLSVLWRLVGMLGPHRFRFYMAVLTLLLGAGIGLAYPMAARFAIDTVKVRAPVWKEEHYADGESRHVEGVPLEVPGSEELP